MAEIKENSFLSHLFELRDRLIRIVITILIIFVALFSFSNQIYLVFPFLAGTTPDGIAYTPDIKEYLDFVLKMFFAFGVAFEVPIATFLLVKTGMTTAESLSQKRPFLIVGSFIVGMLLTPPDIISQTLLALPMWILFEIGLLFAKRIKVDDDYYTEMSDEEMESELDQIEQDEKS